MKKIILSNKIRCKHCNDVLESINVDDYKECSCRRVAAYGGLEHLQRVFSSSRPQDDFEELSEHDLV